MALGRLSKMVEKVIDRFFCTYETKEMNSSHAEIEKFLPRKEDVLNGRDEPLMSSEVRNEMHEELDVTKRQISQYLREMSRTGIAEEIETSQWVSKGRTERRVDGGKVSNLFTFIMILVVSSSLLFPRQAVAIPIILMAVLSLVFRAYF